ncbi:hypothetical protein [Microvirga aerophila]|uniref:Uncharacterized protein n=1 Tax=Microvirga aerophila TaxID=670291 RepID=A0A512C1I7_9HYPH|nr:hypothetical protein [Microvirga aerophila]GEO18085.1 hypothetical protein MAE02_57810 [Microvirga aerophila]
MTGTNVSLSQQVSESTRPKALHDFLSDSLEYHFDLSAPVTGLSEPDHVHHATSESQTFTGVNGEVDHFIFDTDIDGGNYIVNNYEPGSDWLIFASGPSDSVEITAIDGDVTYTVNTDSAQGRVHVNPVGDVFGTSIATITEFSMFI